MKNIHPEVSQIEELLKDESNFIKAFIEKYNNSHKSDFNKKYYGFTIIGISGISFLSSLVEMLNYIKKDKWKDYYKVQYLLIANAIPFIYSTYDNIIKGHYHIASSNNRVAFETLIRLYFINFYPTNYYGIYGKEAIDEMKNKGIKCPDFNVTNFIKDKLGGKIENIYKLLSKESHSNMISILHELDKVFKGTHEKVEIDFKGKLDISINMNIFVMIMYGLIKYIDEILLKGIVLQELNDYNQEIINKTKTILTLFNNYLDKLPHEEKKNEIINNIMIKISDLEK